MFDSSAIRISRYAAILVFGLAAAFSYPVLAQHSNAETQPVIVQPGAPGQPSRILPASTRGKLPPLAKKDIEFMQGMIVHHAQAVEMTELIESRTQNRDVRVLGARISSSQIDEMEFMRRWLKLRGERESPTASGGGHAHNHSASQHAMMPGMLSQKQMDELRRAKGAEFDRLFLAGMIQHHEGALIMVKELFDTAGAGQDAELFNFATDVDTGQRAEIATMQNLLTKKP